MQIERTWHTNLVVPDVAKVDDAFLLRLAQEIDGPDVTAIVLAGSCVRKEETVFSDVDLKKIVKEPPKGVSHTRYWREGRLISVAIGTTEQYRKRLYMPEEAVFLVPGLRESRILVEKEGSFRALQKEAECWTWEPLQEAANTYVTDLLIEYAEWAIKLLRAFLVKDEYALAEMTQGLLSASTSAIIVQKGILAASGNSYFRQAQEAAGQQSTWTYYHRLLTDMHALPQPKSSLEEKGIIALCIYKETFQMLKPALNPEKRGVIEQTIHILDEALLLK